MLGRLSSSVCVDEKLSESSDVDGSGGAVTLAAVSRSSAAIQLTFA